MSDFETSDQNWLHVTSGVIGWNLPEAAVWYPTASGAPAKQTAQDDGWDGSSPLENGAFSFYSYLFAFGCNTWKASQKRSRLECQHFRALSFKTWRRHNNYKKVCGGRFIFFRGIMVLVFVLGIFYCHFSLLIVYFSTCWESIIKRMVRKVKWEP